MGAGSPICYGSLRNVPESPVETLARYLQTLRDAVVWKLDGLSEYDARRPLTPTGTNILGLVKHLAYVEAGYFGATFGRPFPEPTYPEDEAGMDHNIDMWATAEESREDIVGLYRRVWAHAAETFAAGDVDTPGRVPWWPEERAGVTLHQILVHMCVETARHAGHIDILRELIDESVGMRPEALNLPDDDYDWPAHVARVEAAARAVAQNENVF
jgi:uncharacterized damage-inducible protein DinB